MSRRKNRSQLTTIRDINMTPLIDLVFLLLIVFMITVPLMEYSVDVSPPEMNANPVPDKNTFNVDINKQGRIVYKDAVISPEELNDRLKSLLAGRDDMTVLLRADGAIPYEKVIDVMKVIKNSGVKNISLITQAES